jgi:hypothetical protein
VVEPADLQDTLISPSQHITVRVLVNLASNGEAFDQVVTVKRAVANYRPRIRRCIEADYSIAAWLAVIDHFAAICAFGFTGGRTSQ